MIELDITDRRILELLQSDGRLTHAALAERLALSVTPCWRRVKRLESAGLIRGYHAVLDRHKLGIGLLAFVRVRCASHAPTLCEQFEAAVRALPQVIACHDTTGEMDYLLQVVASDVQAYGHTVTFLRNLPAVETIHSSLALREIKQSFELPLASDTAAARIPRP